MTNSKLFAVFGNPIKHSISPILHNSAIKGLGLNGVYIPFLLEDSQKLKNSILDSKIDGANITVPHKEQAFNICDEIIGMAQDIGAINTITNKNGKLIGYNTDAPGFISAISEFENVEKVLLS